MEEDQITEITQTQATNTHGTIWNPEPMASQPPIPQEAVGIRLDGTPILPGEPDAKPEPTQETEVKKNNDEKKSFPLTNSEFRVVVEIMTMRQLLDSRKPGIRNRHCVINTNPNIDNYTNINLTICTKITEARVYTVQEVLNERVNFSSSWVFALLDEDLLAKEPPQRKMDLESCINPTLIQLMKVAPQNQIVHGHLMAIFGRLPPAELTTYDQIRDWCEFGFYLPKWMNSHMSRIYGRTNTQYSEARPEANRTDGITLPVSVEETEYGNCRYSVLARAEYDVRISANYIRPIIEEYPDDFESVMDRIKDIFREEAGNQNPGADPVGDYSYDEHESSDSEDFSLNFSRHNLERELINYIRRNYGPEEAQEILGDR